ncbi:hypothetical protein G8C92_30090 [Paenibacillus donghaensis]|nr:hypothetical protein [Paenibacillus donghaensis]MBE9918252.1 hypothetical protein [Paenibacillus donghaensis]
MTLLVIIVLIIGLAGIIGNQYSGLRRMEAIQKSLDDMKRKLEDMR